MRFAFIENPVTERNYSVADMLDSDSCPSALPFVFVALQIMLSHYPSPVCPSTAISVGYHEQGGMQSDNITLTKRSSNPNNKFMKR